MGSLSCKSESSTRSLGQLFGSSGSSGSGSASSGSSPGVTDSKDVRGRLAALERDGAEFSSVHTYTQPISGVAEHHAIVYWYKRLETGAEPAIGTAEAAERVPPMGLQVDWGQDGLYFTDCVNAPAGTMIRSKECGLSPATVSLQVQKIEHKAYNLVQWNCQHFCQHLFDHACGNWRVNAELERLAREEMVVSGVIIYLEAAGDGGDGQADLWTVVFWYHDSHTEAETGLQLRWSTDGLAYKLLVEEPSAGKAIQYRECAMRAPQLRALLREIDGVPFQAARWNSQHFSQHVFDRVLARGGCKRLCEHLEALADRGIEIAGALEFLTPDSGAGESSGDHHVLVYKYKTADQRLVHLQLDFSAGGLCFSEADAEPDGSLLLRQKPMLFVRLQPRELIQQLRKIEDRAYDTMDWCSQHFCAHLFAQAPGRERVVLKAIQTSTAAAAARVVGKSKDKKLSATTASIGPRDSPKVRT